MVFNRTFLYGPLREEEDGRSGGGTTGRKALEKTAEVISNMEDAMRAYTKRAMEAQQPLVKLLDAATKIRDANERLVQSGGDFYSRFAPGGEYNRSMEEIARLSQDFFGNAEAGIKTMEGLAIGMKSFAGVSPDVQREIAKTTMFMGKLGFEVGQVAKAFENQAMAFGTSEKDLQKYATTMSKLSSTLFIEPTKLMDNFDFAQKNFAYNAEQTLDVFVRLQEQSRKSGVEFGTMTSAFGEGMDTFQGVSGLAGRLNSILGSSVFNPMQLLNMDEAERAAAIRRGIQESPMLGGKDINQLSKFELKSIAKTLDMSVLETRKFLTNQGDVRQAFQDTLDNRMGPQGVDGLTQLQSTDQELLRMQDTIRDLRGELANQFIDSMKRASAAIDTVFAGQLREKFGIDDAQAQTLSKDYYTMVRLLEQAAVRPGIVTADDRDPDRIRNRAGSDPAINPALPGSERTYGSAADQAAALGGLIFGKPGTATALNFLAQAGMDTADLKNLLDSLKQAATGTTGTGTPTSPTGSPTRQSPSGPVDFNGNPAPDPAPEPPPGDDGFLTGFKDLFSAAMVALASDTGYVEEIAKRAAAEISPRT